MNVFQKRLQIYCFFLTCANKSFLFYLGFGRALAHDKGRLGSDKKSQDFCNISKEE